MSNRVSFLKRVVNNLIEARARAVQRDVRQYLRGLSDRQLADMGFSRELLEQGPEAWPWRAAAESSSAPSWGHAHNLEGMAQPTSIARRDSQRTDHPVTADDKLAA